MDTLWTLPEQKSRIRDPQKKHAKSGLPVGNAHFSCTCTALQASFDGHPWAGAALARALVSGAIDVVKALEPLLRSSGESPDDRCGDSAEGSVE